MTNSLPLVSIIIPAYNTAPYIHRAIESSLRQTHNNTEVIIVDDGSSDDTLKVAQEYAAKNERVRVFTQENAGVSSARNHGIREAHGEYLYFLDSDDWLEDNAIATLLEAQAQYPDKLIAANFCRVVEKNDKFFRSKASNIDEQSVFLNKQEVTEQFCGLGRIAGFHSCFAKIYRADAGLKFNEDLHYSEDVLYTFEYLNKVTGVYYVNIPVLNVFISEESLTRSKSYRLVMLDSQINAFTILENYPGNTPYMREIIALHRCRMIRIPLRWALERSAPSSEVKRARNAMKPYARLYLHSDKVSFVNKILFFVGVYLPIPLVRLVLGVYDFLEGVKKKFNRHGEEFPRW